VIYFTSFAFGPWIGLVAGGVGTGLADLLGGYGAFAPLTLLAHGLQGFLAGWLGHDRGLVGVLLGWLAGTIAMVGLYFLGEATIYGFGWPAALAEVLPNLGQNAGGGLIGIPLYYAVRAAYPPITRMGREAEWREEQP
jgi:energy-coupling factor transport system substrate-specific component